MKYAREGCSFYNVITPSCFVEFELPDDPGAYTSQDQKNWEVLEKAAETRGQFIEPCAYRRG